LHRRIGFWIAAVISLTADLFVKAWAFAHPGTAGDGLVCIPGVLKLIRHHNSGMVFGLASGRTVVILGIVAFIIPALVILAYSCRAPGAPLWALGLILGGAAGNLYDRIAHPGVRDFIQMDLGFWPANPWPVFNLADLTIVVGFLVYLAWSLLVPPGTVTPAATQPEDGPPPV